MSDSHRGGNWSADALYDLNQVSVQIHDPGDEQPVEPWLRWLDRPCSEPDEALIPGWHVVRPEDHRRSLSHGDRVELVVVAGAGFRGKPDSVAVKGEIHVDGCSGQRGAKHFLEAESMVEGRRAVDVSSEQHDLRRAKERHVATLSTDF